MIILVSGSRSFYELTAPRCDQYPEPVKKGTWAADAFDFAIWKVTGGDRSKVTTVIAGGARGIDYAAAQWAKAIGCELIEMLPDWDNEGKAAGYIRNAKMIAKTLELREERSEDAMLVAIWDTESKGTAHTIETAGRAGLGRKVFKRPIRDGELEGSL
jgi:hypothetical protein